MLDNVRTSGPAHEHWDEQARALFNSLAKDDTVVAYEGCYVAGCAATLSFASEDDYRRARDEAERSELYRAWTGGKKWSRPDIAEDGRLLVALVVYRPD